MIPSLVSLLVPVGAMSIFSEEFKGEMVTVSRVRTKGGLHAYIAYVIV